MEKLKGWKGKDKGTEYERIQSKIKQSDIYLYFCKLNAVTKS